MPRGTTQFNNAVSADEVAPVLLVRVLDMPYKLYGALSFDGVDDYVSFGTDKNFDYPNFTIELWTKADSQIQTHVKNLIGKGNWNNANNWYLGYKSGTHLSFAYGVIWGVGPSYPMSEFDLTKWHHIAGVATPNELKLYLDGNLVDTRVISHGAVTNSYDLQIARSSYYGNYYDGLITEVRIWNVARTQAEIQADMHRTLAGNEPGLVAYYSMRVPPTDNILPDLSPNNNDGTIYGATYVPITESLYLTDYQEKDVKTIDFFDENWNPCQYVCCNVKYDSIEVGADNTVNEVNITIDNVDRTFSALAQYYRLYGVEVHALTAERSVLNIPEGAVMRFAGKLKEARINEHAIILRVTSGYTLSCLIPKLMYDSKHFPYIPSAKDPRQVP